MKHTFLVLAFLTISTLLIGAFNDAEAKTKKSKSAQPHEKVSYPEAKKICLIDDPYLSGKKLQACIKKKMKK